MCPPDIYGQGSWPGRTQSVYVPSFYNEIKEVGAPFYDGTGLNTRSWVHIDDLVQLYGRVVEAAVAGGGTADWGIEGYYFAASQEHAQINVARAAGQILKKHGLVEDAEPKEVSLDRVDAMMSHWGCPHLGSYIFAANSRSRADRASAKLGDSPNCPGLLEILESDLLAYK